MRNALSVFCMAFGALLWCSAADAQGYAGVMAPAEGSSGSSSGSVSSVYAYSSPSVPVLAPATGYKGVIGGDGAEALVDYKEAKAKRTEEIRLMNEAASRERSERLRQSVSEELNIHQELQRQKDLNALER